MYIHIYMYMHTYMYTHFVLTNIRKLLSFYRNMLA